MTPSARREPVTAREVVGCAALAIVLALAMHWPLPLHLGRDIAQDLGDPLVQAWQIAWDGHALAHSRSSSFRPTRSGRCATASRSPTRSSATRRPG